ncbi:MAG: DUF2804 domain-containing protein [Eubacteriaceae bacterium]|jgi:hypothetical protein|nr:DUF2804 domain-containing protein [Eubacteriaceae bacterium]
MQQELSPGALLDENGRLAQAGYAKALVKKYERGAIKAPPSRIKEWDYYYIGNRDFGLALTIADNSYMGLDSISFLDFQSGYNHTVSPMQLFTFGKKALPPSSAEGNVTSSGKGYSINFENKGETRRLSGYMDKFHENTPIQFDVALTEIPADSMVIATPFPEKPTAFYYNQKINCMRAEGFVMFAGYKYEFDPRQSFGTLDWGRGVWTYSNTWYWGSCSASVEGKRFGFNIGYGFGDTSAASENMLFYEGKAHKLSQVAFNIPQKNGKDDYLSPWTFESDDKRFEMDFVPVLNRASCTNAIVIKSDQNQVFGKFTGKAVLDTGEVIHVKDIMGFAEKVTNRW